MKTTASLPSSSPSPSFDDRRHFNIALTGLVGAFALAACGGGGSDAGAGATPVAPAPSSATPATPLSPSAPTPSTAASGNITLLAGSTAEADRGATNATGTAARFRGAYGITADAAGNVYVADTGNHVIRKVTPAGAVSTLAGGFGLTGTADGADTVARFKDPQSVATDAAGNVYVADPAAADNPWPYGSVRKITPAGQVSTFTASAQGGGRDIVVPFQIAAASNGDVWVGDLGSIRKITSAGVITVLVTGSSYGTLVDGAGTVARFMEIRDMVADSAGNLYVLDADTQSSVSASVIRKVSPTGVVTTLAGARTTTAGFIAGSGSAARFPLLTRGLAIDASGNLYTQSGLANAANVVVKITPDGTASAIMTWMPAVDSPLMSVRRWVLSSPKTLVATSGTFGTAIFKITLP